MCKLFVLIGLRAIFLEVVVDSIVAKKEREKTEGGKRLKIVE